MDKALRCFRHSYFEEIIAATDVGANNLDDLIVKCLCCKEFVDWVAPNKEDSIRVRQAHFRHQSSGNKSFTASCEKRVAQFKGNKLSALERRLAESRNRFIRKEFWKIVRYWYEDYNGFEITNIIENLIPSHRKIGVNLADSFRYHQKNWHPQIDGIFNAIINKNKISIQNPDSSKPYSITPVAEIQRRLIQNIIGKINVTLQKEIVHDVLDFIQKQRKAWEITNQLYQIAFYICLEVIRDGQMLGLEGKDGRQLHVIRDGQISVDLSFWKNPNDRYTINAYCCAIVLALISIIPYNIVIDSMYSTGSKK